MIKDMLRGLSKAYKNLNIDILKYFNPVGIHKSGFIGEDSWRWQSNNPKGYLE